MVEMCTVSIAEKNLVVFLYNESLNSLPSRFLNKVALTENRNVICKKGGWFFVSFHFDTNGLLEPKFSF